MAKTSQSRPRTPARTSKTKRVPKKKSGGKNKSKTSLERAEHGFMYIGHLPHGFFEEEIKSYFSQFGKIIRVRVARSKKTGQYRGYGFVEFADKDVAAIAADTMNNYLMFNKILKCHVIPAERVHPDTFRNAGKLFVTPVKSWLRKSFNRKRSTDQLKKLKEKQQRKMEKRTEKLKSLGINIDLSKLSQFTTQPEAKKTVVPIVAKQPVVVTKKEVKKEETAKKSAKRLLEENKPSAVAKKARK